jgi:chromosome segregation ATPase
MSTASERQRIQSRIGSERARIVAIRERNAQIDRQLERLRIAKRKIDTASDTARMIIRDIDQYDPSAKWAGNTFTHYRQDVCTTSQRAVFFKNQINAIYDRIVDKITQLENERAECFGLLGRLYAVINTLQGELEKANHNTFG